MIIDDSLYNLFVMEELVHQIDPHIEIDTALNGEIALNKIKKSLPRQGPLYDVIFTDIHMPVLDGYEVSKKPYMSNFTIILRQPKVSGNCILKAL